MLIDRNEYPGGYEVRLLFTELDQELIRAAVMIAGLLLVFLIVYMI